VILLALDLDGRITLINRKGCALVEWPESDLLGRDWIETCVPARAAVPPSTAPRHRRRSSPSSRTRSSQVGR
jgi:PAS domain-containing protein